MFYLICHLINVMQISTLGDCR